MKVIKKKIQVIIGDHKKKSSPMPSPTRREIISMVLNIIYFIDYIYLVKFKFIFIAFRLK